jgi:tRNA-guanine transglycosylase
MSFTFEIQATHGPSRAGIFDLPHHKLRTPIFMPVATQGAMKGVTVDMLEELDIEIILGNTYHLGLQPGEEVLRHTGGVHGLQGWRRNILTDSGGFQMVSLLQLSQMSEEGVIFQSTHGSGMLTLRPEDSIRIQNAIGGDIMMQLDDVVSTLTTGPRVEESMYRSIRWLDRCIAANANPEKQCIFGIVQGALDPALRRICVQEMTLRNCKGYAIGGLSGGEKKDDFWRIVALCAELLPKDRPRYCMGVGYPLDILVCIALGVDMFDCVYCCRTARFGTAITSRGLLLLKSKKFAKDMSPLDPDCSCSVCRDYSRSYLHVIAGREGLGATLLSYHNIAYLIQLTRGARQALLDGTFEAYVRSFLRRQFPARSDVPQWAFDALHHVNIRCEADEWADQTGATKAAGADTPTTEE